MIRTPTLAIAMMTTAVACGGASDPVSGPAPGPTLLAVQAQIFTPRCAQSGCHVGAGAPFGLDLGSASSSSANLIGVSSAERPGVARIAPGDPANSYLYWKVTDNPNIGGDPMPLSGVPLNGGELDLIASWIDGGAR